MNTAIEAKDIYTIYQKFINTDTKVIKTNLKYACDGLYIKGNKKSEGNRNEFIKSLGLTKPQFDSMINLAHSSNVTFENFIKLAGVLNLNINSLLRDNGITPYPDRATKKWTKTVKQEFLQYLSENGITATMQKYNITEGTVEYYQSKFSK